jgi:hypothetical protein
MTLLRVGQAAPGVASPLYAAASPNGHVLGPWRWPARIFHQRRVSGALPALRCALLGRGALGTSSGGTIRDESFSQAQLLANSAPPLFHVFSRIATLLTLCFQVPPGSGSGLLDILDGAGNHVLKCCCPFPRDQWRFMHRG